jgi:ArsR family transcriptional regulator
VSEPDISHHLTLLREAGPVTSERRASWVHDRVVPDALTGLSQLPDATSTTAMKDC